MNIEQSEQVKAARDELGLSSSGMANAMGTTYDTYKEWQSGRNRLTPMGKRCIEMLLAMKGTRIGKRFGV